MRCINGPLGIPLLVSVLIKLYNVPDQAIVRVGPELKNREISFLTRILGRMILRKRVYDQVGLDRGLGDAGAPRGATKSLRHPGAAPN